MNATSRPSDPLAVVEAIRPTLDVDEPWPADQRQRALEHILATSAETSASPEGASSAPSARVVPLRMRTRVAVAAGLTAVAAATAVLGLLPGSEVPAASAFAGYRLEPAALSPSTQDEQAQACRDDLLGQGNRFTPAQRTEIADAPLVAADARGGWEFTVLVTPDPELSAIGVYCLSNPGVPLVQEDPNRAYTGTTEGQRPDLVAPIAPGALRTSYGFGYYLPSGEGAMGEFGRVGSDVTAVTVDFPGGTTVQATVQDGWYAAWWPVGDVVGIASDEYPDTRTITTPAGRTVLGPGTSSEPTPDAPPVDQYGQRMADCLRPFGFDVTVNGAGDGYSDDDTIEDQQTYDDAVDRCLRQTGYA